MNDLNPPIDRILSSLFGAILELVRGVKYRRVQQIERLLREFLETDGEFTLCPCNATLVAAEREWEPEGAFCRTMSGDELLAALPFFVRERAPLIDPPLRRVLAESVDRLTGMLVHDRLISYDAQIDTLWEIRNALDDVTAELNRIVSEKRRATRLQNTEAKWAEYRARVEATIARSRQSAEQD